MSTPILTIRQLRIGYARRQVAGLLNADLQPGSLCALLAPNGTGKSTLLRTLAGLQRQLGGTVQWNGHDVDALQPNDLARTVSIVLTARPEATALTVRQVVEMGRMPHLRPFERLKEADRRSVDEALQLTQSAVLSERTIGSLSDGERQRVFVAKALAQGTEAILLDEPTAFLDFPSKVKMLRLLRQLAHEAGKAILLSTHDVELALHFADRLWLLHRAGLAEGTPAQLADDGSIARFFDGEGVHFDAAQMRFVLTPA